MTKVGNRIKHTDQNNPHHVWPLANHFYHTQMLPLLAYVNSTSESSIRSSQLFNKTFKKYLIISCVSLIDNYMTLQIRKIVDEQHIDISKLKLRKKYEKMLIDYPETTEGQCVIAQQDFTNTDTINDIATLVLKQDNQFDALNMRFFDAVKKIDWYDHYKYIKGIEGVEPLTESWDNFLDMFKLRHRIIHEMNDNFIPINRLACMCNNTMNFIDAADFIFAIEHRKDVLERLCSNKTLRERNAVIDRALDIAIEKGKVPPDMVKKIYEHRAR